MAATHHCYTQPFVSIHLTEEEEQKHSRRENEREQETERYGSHLHTGRHRRHSHRNSSVVEWEDDDVHEESVRCPVGVEASGPVPDEEVDDGADNVPWERDDDLRGEEGGPAVHARRTFTNLVHITRHQKVEHDLVGQRDDHHGTDVHRLQTPPLANLPPKSCQKNTHEKLVLRSRNAVLAVKKREANEQPRNNVQRHLRHNVGRISPVVDPVANHELLELVQPGRRKLGLDSSGNRTPRARVFDNLYDLRPANLSLG